jgi:hypothetical protein
MADAKSATIQVDVKMPNPFVRMFYSRKTWWALLALGATLLAHYSGLPAQVQASIIAVGVAMIGSIAWEDAAEKSAATTVTAGGDASVTNVTPDAP